MSTFKVIGLVKHTQLTDILRLFESEKIPYNVELHEVEQPKTEKLQRKASGNGTGRDLILKLLRGGPKQRDALMDSFEKDGRSRSSINNLVHELITKEKLVKKNGKEYSLTAKGEAK